MKRNFILGLLKELEVPLNVSQESVEGLVSNQEIEYTMYFKLTDPTQLFKATTVTEQEQWELTLPESQNSESNGRMRVRVERPKTEEPAKYTLTLKVATPGVTGRKELELNIDEEYFEAFKLFCSNGMRKTRFTFPIEGTEGTWDESKEDTRLCWEIDVFDDPSSVGAECWVKVDLEVPQPLETLPEFPLAHDKAITNQWNERTPEEVAFVKQLFDKVYISKG